MYITQIEFINEINGAEILPRFYQMENPTEFLYEKIELAHFFCKEDKNDNSIFCTSRTTRTYVGR